MQLSIVSNADIRKKAEELMKSREWMLALVEWESWHDKAAENEKGLDSFHDLGICKFNLVESLKPLKIWIKPLSSNLITDTDLQQEVG